jgi:hypothetical protein
MNIKASQFAFYLKSSSLNSDEQRAVLARLPGMEESDIKILFDRLKMDHQDMSEVLQSAHVKRQSINDDLAEQLKSS